MSSDTKKLIAGMGNKQMAKKVALILVGLACIIACIAVPVALNSRKDDEPKGATGGPKRRTAARNTVPESSHDDGMLSTHAARGPKTATTTMGQNKIEPTSAGNTGLSQGELGPLTQVPIAPVKPAAPLVFSPVPPAFKPVAPAFKPPVVAPEAPPVVAPVVEPRRGPWTISAWEACSAGCGNGTQKRNVECNYDTCTGPEPRPSRSCEKSPCETLAVPTTQVPKAEKPVHLPVLLNGNFVKPLREGTTNQMWEWKEQTLEGWKNKEYVIRVKSGDHFWGAMQSEGGWYVAFHHTGGAIETDATNLSPGEMYELSWNESLANCDACGEYNQLIVSVNGAVKSKRDVRVDPFRQERLARPEGYTDQMTVEGMQGKWIRKKAVFEAVQHQSSARIRFEVPESNGIESVLYPKGTILLDDVRLEPLSKPETITGPASPPAVVPGLVTVTKANHTVQVPQLYGPRTEPDFGYRIVSGSGVTVTLDLSTGTDANFWGKGGKKSIRTFQANKYKFNTARDYTWDDVPSYLVGATHLAKNAYYTTDRQDRPIYQTGARIQFHISGMQSGAIVELYALAGYHTKGGGFGGMTKSIMESDGWVTMSEHKIKTSVDDVRHYNVYKKTITCTKPAAVTTP